MCVFLRYARCSARRRRPGRCNGCIWWSPGGHGLPKSRFLLHKLFFRFIAHLAAQRVLNASPSAEVVLVVERFAFEAVGTGVARVSLLFSSFADRVSPSSSTSTGKSSDRLDPSNRAPTSARVAQPRARNAKKAPGATIRSANGALDDRSGGWFASHVIRRAGFMIAGQHEA
jgi:hypothetical protein